MIECKRDIKTVITEILLPSVLVVSLFLSGCANTGPVISREELVKLEQDIELEAIKIFVNDWVRVWKVGSNILDALPEGTLKKRPVIGALIIENSEDIARLYNLSTDKGCVIVGTIDGFIADLAGLQAGDLIKEIDGKKIGKINQLKFKSEISAEIIVERDGIRKSVKVRPKEITYVKITLKETSMINAYAKISGIQFTSGMVHFIKNDDELAVIMGHELAHLTSKHIPENLSIGTLCGLVSIFTGPFAPLTYKSLYAPYGREREREADYFGLIYAHNAGYDIEKGMDLWRRFALENPKSRSRSFLRSHPPSTERILRTKKVVEIMKSGKNPLEDLKSN